MKMPQQKDQASRTQAKSGGLTSSAEWPQVQIEMLLGVVTAAKRER